MATKLQEEFVNSYLLPGKSVLEFGIGDCAWAHSRQDLMVTGIDLYPKPETVLWNVTYIQGNILELPQMVDDVLHLSGGFKNVVSLSAFEHAGIEQPNFLIGRVDLDEHKKVAQKLIELTAPKGRIIVTVPAGDNETYVVDKNGKSHLWNGEMNFLWGYRTFTLNTIRSLFPGLQVIGKKAYLKTGEDYFANESWTEIDPEKISNTYSEQNGLLCVAMEKQQ